jgi:DNA-directed RNA polymerase subunit RPC12/RpoP
MSVETVVIEIGNCKVTVSYEGSFFDADPAVISRVHAFVLDARAMAAGVETEHQHAARAVAELVLNATPATKGTRAEPSPPRGVKLDCPFGCGKQYRRSSMYKHRAVCSNRPDFTTPVEFKCSRCGKTFAKKNGCTIHEKTCKAEPIQATRTLNTSSEDLNLAAANESAVTQPAAPAPILTAVPPHADESILRCASCGETYPVDQLDDFDRHMWDVHNRAAKPFEHRPRTAVS